MQKITGKAVPLYTVHTFNRDFLLERKGMKGSMLFDSGSCVWT